MDVDSHNIRNSTLIPNSSFITIFNPHGNILFHVERGKKISPKMLSLFYVLFESNNADVQLDNVSMKNHRLSYYPKMEGEEMLYLVLLADVLDSKIVNEMLDRLIFMLIGNMTREYTTKKFSAVRKLFRTLSPIGEYFLKQEIGMMRLFLNCGYQSALMSPSLFKVCQNEILQNLEELLPDTIFALLYQQNEIICQSNQFRKLDSVDVGTLFMLVNMLSFATARRVPIVIRRKRCFLICLQLSRSVSLMIIEPSIKKDLIHYLEKIQMNTQDWDFIKMIQSELSQVSLFPDYQDDLSGFLYIHQNTFILENYDRILLAFYENTKDFASAYWITKDQKSIFYKVSHEKHEIYLCLSSQIPKEARTGFSHHILKTLQEISSSKEEGHE